MIVTYASTVHGLLQRGTKSSIDAVQLLAFVIQLTIRDLIYTVLAQILPNRPVGRVIRPGKPGYAGVWPEYVPPTATDSRSPCPALNALANHGILPRNGCQISYEMMINTLQHAYNLSPTLAEQLTASAYVLDQGRGWIDLDDLSAENVVQHDASFTRPDAAVCSHQDTPHPQLIDRFLSKATGTTGTPPDPNSRALTISDIAYYSGLRRAECRASNGAYSLSHSFLHKFFGSGNCALMYSIFGGNVDDLRIWLTEERFPDGWEPRARWSVGHTVAFAQATSIAIEFNIDEDQLLRPGDAFLRDQTCTIGSHIVSSKPVGRDDLSDHSGMRFDAQLLHHVAAQGPAKKLKFKLNPFTNSVDDVSFWSIVSSPVWLYLIVRYIST